MDLNGYAIGGLAVGESAQEDVPYYRGGRALMPADKPRYLMGMGTPVNILEAVFRGGIDLFDCVMPGVTCPAWPTCLLGKVFET